MLFWLFLCIDFRLQVGFFFPCINIFSMAFHLIICRHFGPVCLGNKFLLRCFFLAGFFGQTHGRRKQNFKPHAADVIRPCRNWATHWTFYQNGSFAGVSCRQRQFGVHVMLCYSQPGLVLRGSNRLESPTSPSKRHCDVSCLPQLSVERCACGCSSVLRWFVLGGNPALGAETLLAKDPVRDAGLQWETFL